MKSEQIKEITERATEQLTAALNAGHSEALRDFVLYEDSPEAPRRLSDGHTPRRMPSGHRSQSEADWAYAKRALARGDNPEQIIHRIADYRADDKANPDYYARHTVIKAQAQMRSEIRVFQGETAPDIQRDEENLRR